MPRAYSTPDGRGHRLPAPLTSFIGRQREMGEVARLLATTRLLTLTGAGGAGKTRLALEVAGEVREAFPDGVWLAELASLTDPALVAPAVAAAVGVREQPARPLPATLAAALRPKRLLLLLDNCEHLVEACAILVETLLRACPGVRVLATSREALRCAGETAWRVPSLATPDPRRAPPLEHLAQYEAVRLFADRAAAARPGFAITAGNAPAVVQICHRLDGIPLALELAAARIRMLSAEEIAARLDDRFRLLTGGGRTAPPRQQTLRATVEWSHALLGGPERTLFRRLAVFAGGFTLEGAETVCAGDGLPRDEVLDRLAQLLDKSLVQVELAEERARAGQAGGGESDRPAGAGRYRLLETLAQYGRERLEEAGEGAAVRGRHAACFLALAEQAEGELNGPTQAAWLARLAQEHDNLRAALAWARECRGAESGLRLGGALARFWEVRGHLSEGQRRLEQALEQGAGAPAALRAKALTGAGNLARTRCAYAQARAYHQESLALRRALGDRRGCAIALNNLGVVACDQGDQTGAEALFRESLALKRELGDQRGIALALINLGNVARYRGDRAAAAALHQESLALLRQLGDAWGTALALNNLGRVAYGQGERARAAALCRQSLTVFRELADTWGTAFSLLNLGYVVATPGRWERSARLLGAAEALRETIGAPLPPAERAEHERVVGVLRSGLGAPALAAAWAAGRASTPEQAAALALEPAALPPAGPSRWEAGAGQSEGPRSSRRAGRGAGRPGAPLACPLTPREQEVAALIARGVTSDRQIAAALIITEGTAAIHVEHIREKLGFHSRAQIAAWAVAGGLPAAPLQ